jgi:hypothetical protein
MSVSESATIEKAIAILKELSPRERLKVLEQMLPVTKQEIAEEQPRPKKSLRGIVAHLGPAPSAEDIDEARREAWANFPRDDI